MTARPNHESVAKALAEQPLAPDEVAKARMEKRLLEAVKAEGAPSRAPAGSSRGPWIAVGGALLAAAAALMLFLASQQTSPESPAEPIARFEVRDVGSSAQRGTLEEGSILRTAEGEVADIRIADSSVHLEPGSHVRIAALGVDRLTLELTRGEVRVEFHPRRPGEEQLSVTTAQARVEVVGTVFSVRAAGDSTAVAVSEGRVRVVSLLGGQAETIGAGESLEVGEARTAALEPPTPNSEPELAAEPDPIVEAPEPVTPASNPPVRTVSPARRLARARLLISQGQHEAAERALRELIATRPPVRVRAEALTLVGDLGRRSGRPTLASEAYSEAANLDAGSMSHLAIFALARLQQRELGQPERARASYRRYLEAAPTGALAQQARRALCRLGDDESCE